MDISGDGILYFVVILPFVTEFLSISCVLLLDIGGVIS